MQNKCYSPQHFRICKSDVGRPRRRLVWRAIQERVANRSLGSPCVKWTLPCFEDIVCDRYCKAFSNAIFLFICYGVARHLRYVLRSLRNSKNINNSKSSIAEITFSSQRSQIIPQIPVHTIILSITRFQCIHIFFISVPLGYWTAGWTLSHVYRATVYWATAAFTRSTQVSRKRICFNSSLIFLVFYFFFAQIAFLFLVCTHVFFWRVRVNRKRDCLTNIDITVFRKKIFWWYNDVILLCL